MSKDPADRRIAILDPAPLYTVTVERQEGRSPEVHFHAGGQGFWVARMVKQMGGTPVLCGPFAGESGRVIQVLIEGEGIAVKAVRSAGENGGYIHDRQEGERKVVVDIPSPVLRRHDADDLYDLVLMESLQAGIAVITGDGRRGVADPSFFTRLAHDLGNNGVVTVADISREALRALEGGVTFLKVSLEDLERDGFLGQGDGKDLHDLLQEFARTKARHVIVSRAADPALALVDGQLRYLQPPAFEPADHRGAGDSMTAALAAGLARNLATDELLRLAAAAGALNVTRHGLGTGTGSQIEQLAPRVRLLDVE